MTATATAPAAEAVEKIPGPGTSATARNLSLVSKNAEQIRADLGDILFTRNINVRDDESYAGEEFENLVESIRQTGGITQPVTLARIPVPSEKDGNKNFVCISGYKRLTALSILAKEDPEFGKGIPALVVKPGSQAGFKSLQLIENLHRSGLNHIEKARGIRDIMADTKAGLSQSEIAGILRINESQISQYLKLLDFPVEIQNDIADGSMSFSAARVLMYKVDKSRWLDHRGIAKTMKLGDFEAKINELYGAKPAAADDEKPAEGAVSTNGSKQKPAQLMRAGALKDTVVVFLKEQSGKVDSEKKLYTEKDLVEAKLDAIRTVLQEPGTKLSTDIKPFEEAQKAAQAALEASEEAVKAKEKFFHDQYKAVKQLVNAPVDLSQPDSGKLTPAECYARVNQQVQDLLTDPVKVAALGFTLNGETFLQDLGTYCAEQAKKDKEAADKRKKAKEEADKKAAEEKAAQEASAQAALAAASGQPAAESTAVAATAEETVEVSA